MRVCLIDGVWWVAEMGQERGDCDPEPSELCPLNPTSGRAWLLFLVGEQEKPSKTWSPGYQSVPLWVPFPELWNSRLGREMGKTSIHIPASPLLALGQLSQAAEPWFSPRQHGKNESSNVGLILSGPPRYLVVRRCLMTRSGVFIARSISLMRK